VPPGGPWKDGFPGTARAIPMGRSRNPGGFMLDLTLVYALALISASFAASVLV
jgi:hypothetical protein